MTHQYTLSELGWNHFFQQQLNLEEWEHCTPARVIGQQRTLLQLGTPEGEQTLALTPSLPPLTVGDWLLRSSEGRFVRLLERFSLLSRKAAGTTVAWQLIAANIDTIFIVSSLNLDFNLNRLERYLTLARNAGVEPVIVLTKADCCTTVDDYLADARTLDRQLEVIAVNGLDHASTSQLIPWCQPGKSVAFLGSSGVGKSTLINTLAGKSLQPTQTVREDDDKGRHTTTGRSLHPLTNGAWLLDTPGMRELQLAQCEQGLLETFPEIAALEAQCRFTDCTHQNEPGCAIRAALTSGALDERRLLSYLKLMKEQAWNSASLAEKRARERAFGKMVREITKEKERRY